MHASPIRFIVHGVLLLLLAATAGTAAGEGNDEPTEVLVVGTIHAFHQANPNYPYETIVRILEAYDPAAVCVEIRPEDFRRRSYLTEMMLATIWGQENGRAVHPIDWWDSKRNAREERKTYERTEEYRQEAETARKLEKASDIINTFHRQHGNERRMWRSARKRYASFWNGEAFNGFVRESYRISLEAFGDSCVNLYYTTRNSRMLERIEAAIDQHSGQRVIVLVGVEHKHFCDDALDARDDVRRIDFEAILPLAEGELSPKLTALLEDGDAGPYFDLSDPEIAAQYYRDRIAVLMHGPDMDFDPNVVPAENVRRAATLLRGWTWDDPYSPSLQFELGWLAFHSGRYEDAIIHYEHAMADMDALEEEEHQWREFMPLAIHRCIGLCHDVMGDREQALRSYDLGIDALESVSDPERKEELRKGLYGRLLKRPFRWKRAPIIDAVVFPLPGEAHLVGRYWHVVENVTHDEGDGPRQLTLWVALPVDRREHRVRVGAIQPDPSEILHDPETGNRVVVWRVTEPAQGDRLIFHYDFEVLNRTVLSDIDPEKVSLPAEDSAVVRRYTGSEPWLEVTEEIADQARQIVREEANPYRQARLLFDWTVDQMTYDYPAVTDRGAEKSFARMSGDCGEFSHVFTAMARSLGIPARSVTANWPQGAGGHAWAEIYLEPYGWLPVDTSVAQLVESGLKGQMTEAKVDEFIESRGIPGRDRGWLFGNLYPDRLVVFVGDNVTFESASGEETTFQFMQPGGRAAWPPAIELEGLAASTVDTGFYLFGNEATDGVVARGRAATALGPAYLEAGLFDQAVAALERKLEETPDHATTLFQLGQAYFDLGRHDEALATFERSLAGEGGSTKPTTDTWSHIFIGMCNDLAGNREEAKAAYQSAIDVGADFGGSQATARAFLEEPFSMEEEGGEGE